MSRKKLNKVVEIEKDRGSLFYNQYEWSVGWHQPEITVLRDSLEDFKIEKAIANARYWERQRSKRWDYHSLKQILGPETFKSQITKKVVADIYAVRNLLVEDPAAKRVLSLHYITVYTSNLALKDLLIAHAEKHTTVTVTHANVIYPKDAVMLLNPQHRYRTYLRSQKVSDQNLEIFENWLNAQQGEIVASPGIQSFLKNHKSRYYFPTNYTADYHYFDHNDMKYVTMLRMVLPVEIRKTVPILAK